MFFVRYSLLLLLLKKETHFILDKLILLILYKKLQN